jgi:pimeloyl-ACP methyl ester carboxylesterase
MSFALVHGAWHDASCWNDVAADLRRRGHRVVTPDLPATDPDLGVQAYADAVCTALGPPLDGERTVLVGHSLGGLTVPVVTERLGPDRVAALVLLAALTPRPGASFDDQVRADRSIMAHGFGRGQQRHDDGTSSWPTEAAVAGPYAGVADEIDEGAPGTGAARVATAVAGMRRQAWRIGSEVTPLREWPAVPTTVLVCAQDRVVGPEAARRRAAELGARVVELPGGHFPMLTRPTQLAAVLHDLAIAA